MKPSVTHDRAMEQQHQSSHLRLSRFAILFLQLRPDVSWQRAISRGVAAYAYASDIDPEAVARIDARVSSLVLRPGRRSSTSPPGSLRNRDSQGRALARQGTAGGVPVTLRLDELQWVGPRDRPEPKRAGSPHRAGAQAFR